MPTVFLHVVSRMDTHAFVQAVEVRSLSNEALKKLKETEPVEVSIFTDAAESEFTYVCSRRVSVAQKCAIV